MTGDAQGNLFVWCRVNQCLSTRRATLSLKNTATIRDGRIGRTEPGLEPLKMREPPPQPLGEDHVPSRLTSSGDCYFAFPRRGGKGRASRQYTIAPSPPSLRPEAGLGRETGWHQPPRPECIHAARSSLCPGIILSRANVASCCQRMGMTIALAPSMVYFLVPQCRPPRLSAAAGVVSRATPLWVWTIAGRGP